MTSNSFSSRSYSDPADTQAILAFVRAVRPPERVCDYPSLNDLQELLPLAEIRANTRLWFDPAGKLAAFAFVDTFSNLWFEFEPVLEQTAGAEIVQFGVDCIRGGLVQGESGSLDTNCAESNPARLAFLTSRGYIAQPEQTLSLARRLSEPIPAPALPPGYNIRPLKGESEAEAVAALHCAAFGSDYMTTENRLAMMRTPEYAPEMDLVVAAPDGSLAGYAMGFISNEENERTGRKDGHVDPIATHPNHQRLGLARALLLTGMQMLKDRGMDTAKLGTSSKNLSMQKTAQAVGFFVESRTIWLSKVVENG